MSNEQESLRWEQWALVITIVVAFLLVPGVILIRPPTDVSFRFAYLILPTIPAVALGVIAVLVALRRP